ncbi:MAG: twin-arginine translocase TatA/TatE family subunit [Actinomycetota bacterium]|nr:twin-arginine translocase TatA/TatE family subunit [Actinomycetota bacterium]
MFGLGIPELLIILVVVLVIFGPKKLPELGKAIGSTLRELRKSNQGDDETKDKDEAKVGATKKEDDPPAAG